MIVLHGVWIPAMDGVAAGKLAIWGEDSSLSVHQPKRGRKAAKPQTSPQTHPFAAATEELRLTLGTLVGDGVDQRQAVAGHPDTAALLLPSVGDAPIPSPGMIRPREDALGFPLSSQGLGPGLTAFPAHRGKPPFS